MGISPDILSKSCWQMTREELAALPYEIYRRIDRHKPMGEDLSAFEPMAGIFVREALRHRLRLALLRPPGESPDE